MKLRMDGSVFTTRLQGKINSEFLELFKRHSNNPILTASDWPYPVNTVFNPGVTEFQGKTLLLARVEDRRGISHFTKAVSEDGISNWKIETFPTMYPSHEEYPEEMWGIEDPRITFVSELNKWAITYTAYSNDGPLVSLALTEDFSKFERLGTILPPDDKDAAIFPERINRKWMIIHRPFQMNNDKEAHVCLSDSSDFKKWENTKTLLKTSGRGYWDSTKIGLNTPPLKTHEGWLFVYHGVKSTCSGYLYRLGLCLLDAENPEIVLNRSDEWIFGPSEEYEKFGDVKDVVFPGGWIWDKKEDIVRMYYGGADTCICLATATLSDLLTYIKKCPSG